MPVRSRTSGREAVGVTALSSLSEPQDSTRLSLRADLDELGVPPSHGVTREGARLSVFGADEGAGTLVFVRRKGVLTSCFSAAEVTNFEVDAERTLFGCTSPRGGGLASAVSSGYAGAMVCIAGRCSGGGEGARAEGLGAASETWSSSNSAGGSLGGGTDDDIGVAFADRLALSALARSSRRFCFKALRSSCTALYSLKCLMSAARLARSRSSCSLSDAF